MPELCSGGFNNNKLFQKYLDDAEKDKERYNREMEAYQKTDSYRLFKQQQEKIAKSRYLVQQQEKIAKRKIF